MGMGRTYPVTQEKSVQEIARLCGHEELALQVENELFGEKDARGHYCVKKLQKLAKEMIRKKIIEDGINIKPKVEKLEYPSYLKRHLVLLGN